MSSKQRPAAKQVLISFDEMNRIRILDAEAAQKSDELAREADQFGQRIETFSGAVQALVEVLSSQAKKIEQEKLMAIGQMNRIDGETEQRKRKQQQMRDLIRQREQAMQRTRDHYDSLVKVESEQRMLMERLLHQAE